MSFCSMATMGVSCGEATCADAGGAPEAFIVVVGRVVGRAESDRDPKVALLPLYNTY